MPLQIISHRGIRLNEGIGKARLAPNTAAENTKLSYPGLMQDTSAIDFRANVYENTLTAITTAWRLGYKVETDVYRYGVIHHARFINGDYDKLIDDMAPEAIAQVNLSDGAEAMHDGNRIPLLEEILDAQIALMQEGLLPPPRLQLELKKPVDIDKVIGLLMEHIMARKLSIYSVRITSMHYDLLVQALDRMADFDTPIRPEVSYLIMREALDYVYLDPAAPDYVHQLTGQAMEAIPDVLEKRLVLLAELKEHFPELVDMNREQMEAHIPDIVSKAGVATFAQRYEAFLALFIGSGLNAGYRLKKELLEDAAFDSLIIPMDSRPGIAEAFKEFINGVEYRGRRLRTHARNVSNGGRNPSQLLRAFVLMDDNAEIALDYPEMVPGVFADIASRGVSSLEETTKIALDPTRKVRIENLSLSKAETELALQRFFELIGLPFDMVEEAPSRIGGRRGGSHISIKGSKPE